MIDTKQIPDEVVRASFAEYTKQLQTAPNLETAWAATIAAALAAWPDAFITKYSEGAPAFNIPLKETQNAE